MDEAEHRHRLAFIRRGRLIASGSPEKIRRQRMKAQVLEITPDDTPRAVKPLRRTAERGTLSLREVSMYGPLAHVVGTAIDQQKEAIADVLREANAAPGDVSVIEPSLEDVFVECMR